MDQFIVFQHDLGWFGLTLRHCLFPLNKELQSLLSKSLYYLQWCMCIYLHNITISFNTFYCVYSRSFLQVSFYINNQQSSCMLINTLSVLYVVPFIKQSNQTMLFLIPIFLPESYIVQLMCKSFWLIYSLQYFMMVYSMLYVICYVI